MKKLGLAVLILFSAFGCDRAKKNEQPQSTKSEQEWQAAIGALAKQHQAITDWESRIPDRMMGPFTLDVSRSLIQTNDRPVLLVMELSDVFQKERSYTARFTEYFMTNASFQLVVELKCTENQADRLLRTKDDPFRRYAVIARITEVSRPQFAVTATKDGEDVGIELDVSPIVFLAKGICLDLLSEEPRPEPIK